MGSRYLGSDRGVGAVRVGTEKRKEKEKAEEEELKLIQIRRFGISIIKTDIPIIVTTVSKTSSTTWSMISISSYIN